MEPAPPSTGHCLEKLHHWSMSPATAGPSGEHQSSLEHQVAEPLRSACCWPCCWFAEPAVATAAEDRPARLPSPTHAASCAGAGIGATTVSAQGPGHGGWSPRGMALVCRDGSVLITERPAACASWRDGCLDARRDFRGSPRCWPRGKGGCLDVAVDPDFRAHPFHLF